MKVVQSGIFFRTVKKLHKKEKMAVEDAVRKVAADTSTGDMKKGALIGVRVYKFKVSDKQYLLAYRYDKKLDQLTLLALGSHENFYRDLPKYNE